MNIYDFMFIFGFIVMVAITLYKLWNIFNVGQLYDLKVVFILFVAFIILFLVNLSIVMIQPERLIFVAIQNINNLLMSINALFIVLEILLNVGAFANNKQTPYSSRGKVKY